MSDKVSSLPTDHLEVRSRSSPQPGQEAFADPGTVLCLSGGGFRAALFHIGALRRLNELGVLPRISVITSVSGGSVVNGVLATRWTRLKLRNGIYTNFDGEIASPIERFCQEDLRTPLLIGTRLDPANLGRMLRDGFAVSGNFLAEAYRTLYGNERLTDVPQPSLGIPRFVFCATCVQTGACWHFHGGPEGRMGDFYFGYKSTDGITIREAVAASSAFPLAIGALRLRIEDPTELSRVDPWGNARPVPNKRADIPDYDKRTIWLTDGGVYDNLGVEPVWNSDYRMLISDAGQPFQSTPTLRQFVVPRLKRAVEISSAQVGAVRKRWLLREFTGKIRRGTLWSIDTRVEDYPVEDGRGYGPVVRSLFPAVRTDLNAFTFGEVACLENHGYSLADAALRSYAPDLCLHATAAFHWPHQRWSDDSCVQSALNQSGSRRLLHDFWRWLL